MACLAVEDFPRDKDLATLNPLYVKRETPRTQGEEKKAAQEGWRSHLVQFTARALLFIGLPLAFVWLVGDTVVQENLLLLTYAQIIFVILLQCVMVHSFLKQPNKMLQVACIGTVVYIAASIVCRSLPDTVTEEPYEVVKGCARCTGHCTYFTREDVPDYVFPGFFRPGEDRVMARGRSKDGREIPGDELKKALAILQIFDNEDLGLWTICGGMGLDLVFGSLFRPCNVQCKPSIISYSKCMKYMQDDQCVAGMMKAKAGAQEKVLTEKVFKLAHVPLAANREVDKLAKDLIYERSDILERAFANFTLSSSFCKNKKLFAEMPYPRLNCTETGSGAEFFSRSSKVSHVATIAKYTWAFTISLVFLSAMVYTPSFPKIKVRHTLKDTWELCLCIGFLALINYFLFKKLAWFEEGMTKSTAWREAVAHTLGTLIVATTLILFRTCAALREKSPRVIDTQRKNVLLKWYAVFETLTDVKDGKYYFQYIIALEFVEITLQMVSFDAMVRTNDIKYVVGSVCILSGNLVVTPLALHMSRFDEAFGREVTFVTDAILETLYLFLNLNYVSESDLQQFSILLSVAFPLCTLLAKVDTFIEYKAMYLVNKADRDTWMKHLFDKPSKWRSTFIQGNIWNKIKWKRASCCISTVMVLSGIGFFVVMMGNIFALGRKCGNHLGDKIWDGAYPRRVLTNGAFEAPECHFETIESIEAEGQGINKLTTYIGHLTNLKKIHLPNNDIKTLPREMTKLTKLTHVDLSNNRVWTILEWERQSFSRFPRIISHFTDLRWLSLSHNLIKTVPGAVARLSKLEVLLLQNNSIARKGLSKQITTLSRLESLKLSRNPVATALEWHSVDPPGAIRILRHMKSTLRGLDLSNGAFDTAHTSTILKMLIHLKRLNVSRNKLESLSFSVAFDNTTLEMLDVDYNPVREVKLKTFYNLDSIWKRGRVYMGYLKAVLFRSLKEEILPSKDFPLPLLAHYFRNNMITAVKFVGDGKVSFPVCDLSLGIGNVEIVNVRNISIVCIERLTKVQRLLLNNNQIRSLNLTRMTSLQRLYLHNNNLKVLDEKIGSFKSLERLGLWNNNFTGIVPASFSALSVLECLNLRNNRLEGSIPWLRKLTRLKRLDVRNNSFAGNISIEGLEKLEYLGVGGSGLTFNESQVMKILPERDSDHFRQATIFGKMCDDFEI